ncbi:hypothetical protein PLEOSDRAFT_1081449 [Pleurotus ostreatus PC15]|uniref:Uncharacterized protein n=1 Tax=Pleurotus ostreatus (strain PC15) TaxID=1137138 RepID=A0A067NYU6_PLEO1|nr:hypothetical protein PLEOSDRAFT_1081449 [Pleurotus ostreatus PC15]
MRAWKRRQGGGEGMEATMRTSKRRQGDDAGIESDGEATTWASKATARQQRRGHGGDNEATARRASKRQWGDNNDSMEVTMTSQQEREADDINPTTWGVRQWYNSVNEYTYLG